MIPGIKYINQSLLGMVARCQLQAEFYLRGIRIPPAAAAHRGIGTHAAARADANLIRSVGVRLTIEALQDTAADAFDHSVERGVYFSNEEASDWKRVLAKAKDESVKAASIYGVHVSPQIGEPLHIEEEVVCDFEGLGMPLGGTIDLIHRDNTSGKYLIFDLKTTAKKPTPADIARSLQAILYHCLAARVYDLETHFSYEFLVVQVKTLTHQSIQVEPTIQAEHLLIERAKILEGCVEHGLFMPTTPDAWWCSSAWCGYWGLCPHGMRQAVSVPFTVSEEKSSPNPKGEKDEEF